MAKMIYQAVCSECKRPVASQKQPYCGWCGAKFDPPTRDGYVCRTDDVKEG